MPSPDRFDRNRPFRDLKKLLHSRSIVLDDTHPVERSANPPTESPSPDDDARLFEKEMSDVTPLRSKNRTVDHPEPPLSPSPLGSLDCETDLRLRELIQHGRGFRVSDTSEYMEGTGACVPPNMSTRLHNGDFAIQAHLDLHGKTTAQAEESFEGFMKEARRSGKQGLLVIHGRGLSSKEKPVLKEKVRHWLTRGPWRKWVAAFSSARLCDGGAGATYILLRNRPLTRRFKKGRRSR